MASCTTTNWYLEWSGNVKWPIPLIGEKALSANFYHFPQREGKKVVTKGAFHAGKMVF